MTTSDVPALSTVAGRRRLAPGDRAPRTDLIALDGAPIAFQGDLPFDVVADPTRALYRRFGVEAGWRSILDPRAWGAMLRGMFGRWSMRRGEGGHLGLPADCLIAPDGAIVAARYGRHAADHWSVDEVLALSAAHRAAR